jgi:hypothetical protein
MRSRKHSRQDGSVAVLFGERGENARGKVNGTLPLVVWEVFEMHACTRYARKVEPNKKGLHTTV